MSLPQLTNFSFPQRWETYQPSFYDPNKLDNLYPDDLFQTHLFDNPDFPGDPDEALLYRRNDMIAREGVQYANYYGIPSALDDGTGEGNAKRVALILVDMQIDFILGNGALSVPGAVGDVKRLVEWAFRNLPSITEILASLDTHLPYQIFHPLYWRTVMQGEWQMPHPLTPITSQDYMSRYQPIIIPEFDVDDVWNESYVVGLEQVNKKTLMEWTIHCLEGSVGRSLHPAISDLILFHSAARQVNPTFRPKGTSVATEQYEIWSAERPVPNDPDTQLDANALFRLAQFDEIYIAGEAKSHCTLETIRKMVEWGEKHAKDMLSKMNVMMDCMSSVQHPKIDFDTPANRAYESFSKNYGLNLIHDSTRHTIAA